MRMMIQFLQISNNDNKMFEMDGSGGLHSTNSSMSDVATTHVELSTTAAVVTNTPMVCFKQCNQFLF
jgi:hypothetical protein